MKIDKNSYGTVAMVYLIVSAIVVLLFVFVDGWYKWLLMLPFLWVAGWQTAFHMVPVRKKAGNDHVVSAVSDGKIVIIGKAYEKEYLKCDCIMVSIYMDFWDVHANFWPVTGEVTYSKYYPGKHFLAFKPKASDENEHTCTSVHTTAGKDIFFKQIAGGFARRIVCYGKPGLQTEAGAQCGIIKFGSRIDMYLPLDAEIKVELGQTVRACETVIAEI